MKDWQVRVMREVIDLDTKIIKLERFVTSKDLTDGILLEQLYHMGRYRHILDERIASWTQDETS